MSGAEIGTVAGSDVILASNIRSGTASSHTLIMTPYKFRYYSQ